MPDKDHDKVKVIVQETIQHVYLLDPDDPRVGMAIGDLETFVLKEAFEGIPGPPPSILAKRALKGPPMPVMTLRAIGEADARHSVFSGLTVVIPDEKGNPVFEKKFTNTTISTKPVKA